MRTVETIDALVRPLVASLGYELDEVEFKKEQGNWVLTLYLDGENPITLGDCEKVSRAVEPILDEADPIEQAYYLSVSSIGLDRPLKKDKDFARNVGKALDVRLYAPIDKKKEYTGTLLSFDEESFTLKLKAGAELKIKRKDASSVKPHLDF
ncbi:MAG: ribosome maturation factor RimP [Clostridiaceae bacterium]|nr:ribosome maturation factor RimP [Eubacteriales bacterium]